MIQDLPPSKVKTRWLLFQESLAFAASGLLIPFGLTRSSARTARRADQRTIVLVHGYLANRSSLLPLRAYLRFRGLKQILSFDYRSGPGIRAAAAGLRDDLRRNVRGGRIDLVCHSMGGLVARFYLQELGGARRVDRCITLGTPHRGTYNAYWVASKVGRQLRPDSPLLARLESTRHAAANVRFTSIVGGADNIVLPRVFGAHEDLVYLPDLGHMGLLFSPTVFRVVADRLVVPTAEQRPEPAAVTASS